MLSKIKTWDDWCRFFQDIDSFKPLIKMIFENHNLQLTEIKNTYPGTNAVFKVDNYITKIFVPEDIMNWQNEYHIEMKLNNLLNDVDIKKPKVLYSGLVSLDYDWYYIIYQHIDGVHIKDVLHGLSSKQKIRIAQDIKHFTKQLSMFTSNQALDYDAFDRERWSFLNDEENSKRVQFLKENPEDLVLVHGDLTGDNVLFSNNGIAIIDYGDSGFRPQFYDYAPIVLDLFQLDSVMIKEFFKGYSKNEIVEILIKSIFIHDFGGSIVKEFITLNKEEYTFDEIYLQVKNELEKKITL